MRYFIEIAYNGKNYCGWQKQPTELSVQEVLDRALSTILREEIKTTGAGRTDAGVHAKQLFAHFNSTNLQGTENIIFKLNSLLPKDIAVQQVFLMAEEAHARFDATQRGYQYYISLKKDPFTQEYCYQLHQTPDVALMQKAADLLLGHKDFQCFSKTKTNVKTYHCTVQKAVWKVENEKLIFTITADRFLRNMVRAIVGTLLEVGFQKITLQQFKEIIEKKDRRLAGTSAPAHGLYLTEVKYPSALFLKTHQI